LRDAPEHALLRTSLLRELGGIESGGERGMYQRRVVLYARRGSLRCWRAKRILARGGYYFEVVEAAEDSPSGVRKRLTHGRTYRQALPYLFVDDRPVGGLAEIRALGGSGTFEHLVRGEL
jgi:glutaredoxin